MQKLSIFTQLLALFFLGLIAYNTGTGKTLPVHQPSWASCDGFLTQKLFYRSLLSGEDGLEDVVSKLGRANTNKEIIDIVRDETNIDASKTLWFESATEPSACQAKVYLKSPNKDGDNAAYVGFTMYGYLPAESSWIQGMIGGTVLESVQIDRAGTHWFKD